METRLTDPSTAFETAGSPGDNRINRVDSYISYDADAVLKYRAESMEALRERPGQLVEMIKHHRTKQVPRLNALEQYYLANNPAIMTGRRRRDRRKADHRARTPYAAIISDFLNSYVIGNPVKIEADEDTADEKDFMLQVYEFNKNNDIDSHNIEIGRDQNNFGRAFELILRTEDDEDKIYLLDPKEVFMIYDQTVRSKVIGACRYIRANSLTEEKEAVHRVELYTTEEVVYFKPVDLSQTKVTLSEEGVSPHSFSGVPIIEYRSDRYRMGTFERQLPGIDLYDAAQSDTANYMTDINDAVLLLKGRIAGIGDDGSKMDKMLDANIILLTGEESYTGQEKPVSAEYLIKSYDVAGVEAYKSRIKTDIFTGSSTPDLSDDSFSGNQSGEALKYKMYGLQQKRMDKEKFLAKGFRVRYKLLANLKNATKEYTGKVPDLTFKFTPNLPKAFLEEMKTYIGAGGTLSQETMISLLSFIEDAKDEIQRIQDEQEEKVQGRDEYGFSQYGHEILDGGILTDDGNGLLAGRSTPTT